MRFVYKNLKWLFYLMVLMAGLIFLPACLPTPPPPDPTSTPEPVIYGNIVVKVFNSGDPDNIVDDYIVRVAETNEIAGNDNGVMKLKNCSDGQHITAWASGYYIKTENCISDKTEYKISLDPITFSNNTNLSWITAGSGNEPLLNCISCHNGQIESKLFEYKQWQIDGHSTVFYDQYFSTMYMGDDIYRNQVINTTWTLGELGHQIRILQNPSVPYWGTGFKLDYPTENGNCVYCHAPTSAIGSQTRPDLSSTINEARYGQSNIFTEGINCDICHKVVNVLLDSNGYPHQDKPGILSYEFIHSDRNLFMGPLTNAMDINNMVQNFSCAPVFSESSFCAPCHTAKFSDMQIYNSYGEWMNSKYGKAENKEYKTCQSCHMLPEGITELSEAPLPNERSACSTNNKSYFDFNHNMMLRGEDNMPSLIKQAGEMNITGEIKNKKIELNVIVSNTNAGHKFPTDSPLRHLILVIDAKASSGTQLPLISGDRIPKWGGIGTTSLDYAGKPGQIYANILMSEDTYFSPAVDYWNPTQLAWDKSDDPPMKSSDTRIGPFSSAESKYYFPFPSNKKVSINIKLIYRFAFIDLARLKGWNCPDILITEWECTPKANDKELDCNKKQ